MHTWRKKYKWNLIADPSMNVLTKRFSLKNVLSLSISNYTTRLVARWNFCSSGDICFSVVTLRMT